MKKKIFSKFLSYLTLGKSGALQLVSDCGLRTNVIVDLGQTFNWIRGLSVIEFKCDVVKVHV